MQKASALYWHFVKPKIDYKRIRYVESKRSHKFILNNAKMRWRENLDDFIPGYAYSYLEVANLLHDFYNDRNHLPSELPMRKQWELWRADNPSRPGFEVVFAALTKANDTGKM